MRLILAALGLGVGGAVVAASLLLRSDSAEPVALPQSAMPGRLLVGFQDDATFRWAADRAEMLDQARDASASVIRTTVVWSDVAPSRPAQAMNPFDRAYRMDEVDDLARSAQQRGIELLITIWGTPAWANGGEPPNRPPRDPPDLADFAPAPPHPDSRRPP